MHYHRRLAWWSPDPRGILIPGEMRISRSLARSRKKFRITIDQSFEEIIDGCADPDRPLGWINAEIRAAYVRLHKLGHAHSVETRDASGAIVGGLYGVAIGAFFAAESKFHRATDASKVALAALSDLLAPFPNALIDVQWATPHLQSLGVVDVSRGKYLELLKKSIALDISFPPPTMKKISFREDLSHV